MLHSLRYIPTKFIHTTNMESTDASILAHAGHDETCSRLVLTRDRIDSDNGTRSLCIYLYIIQNNYQCSSRQQQPLTTVARGNRLANRVNVSVFVFGMCVPLPYPKWSILYVLYAHICMRFQKSTCALVRYLHTTHIATYLCMAAAAARPSI